MKGLIFKELYLARKRLFISLGIYFFLMLMCLLVKLSAVHGNLRLLSDESVKNTTEITFYLAIFGSLLAFTGFVADNINADIICRWSNFQRSTSLTEKQVVSSAYIANAILLLSMTAIHTLASVIVCAVFGKPFRAYYIGVFLAFAALSFLMWAYRQFCFYYFRQSKKASLVFSATWFVLYIAVCLAGMSRMGAYRDKAEAENAARAVKMGMSEDSFDSMDLGRYIKDDFSAVKDFMTSYWWIFALLLAAIIVTLYLVSIKALKRPFDLAGQTIADKKEKKSFFSLRSAPSKAAKGDEN